MCRCAAGGHPQTSRVTAALVESAVAESGLPDGTFALIEGVDAGVTPLQDPRVRAGGFTGSLAGGRALHDIARNRPDPIPFFAEMGSVNPVFVTAEAVRARSEEIVAGFTGSYTLGVGQFCTKPGLFFLPSGHGLDDRLIEAARGVASGRMLDERIHDTHADLRATLTSRPGIRSLIADTPDGEGLAGPALLATDVRSLLADADALLTECFGPTAIIVEYRDLTDAVEAVTAIPGSLTATIHAEDSETGLDDMIRELRTRAGRLVWNGWPTATGLLPGLPRTPAARRPQGPQPAASAPASQRRADHTGRGCGMRVLAVVGSPNAGGRSTVAARAVLDGARSAGAEVDLVELSGTDGPDKTVEALDRADGIVFAAPVYRPQAAYPSKTFLDGLPRGMWGETAAPLQGKACAVVLTGASWHHFLAVDDLRGVLAGFFATQVLSPGLYLPGEAFADGDRVAEESATLAAQHGAGLVDLTQAVRNSEALRGLRPLA